MMDQIATFLAKKTGTVFALLKKYVQFSGRATQKEFWVYTLVNIVFCAVALGAASLLTQSIFFTTSAQQEMQCDKVWQVLQALILLVFLIPVLAVTVRRLHDFGQSGLLLLPAVWLVAAEGLLMLPFHNGWLLLLISLISFFVWVYLVVLCFPILFQKSQPEENLYGPFQPEFKLDTAEFENGGESYEDDANLITAFFKFKDFSGRATRKEFWLFVLATALVSIGLALLNFLLVLLLYSIAPARADYFSYSNYLENMIYQPELILFVLISFVWRLGIIFPTFAVAFRRLNDCGRSTAISFLMVPYFFYIVIADWMPDSLFPPVVKVCLALIAIICGGIFLYYMCLPSLPYAKDEVETAEEETGEATEATEATEEEEITAEETAEIPEAPAEEENAVE